MASLKLFTIIILSLTVSCETTQQKLTALRKKVHPFLAPYVDFNTKGAALAVSAELNGYLQITSDPSEQEWFSFLAGAQSTNADVEKRGDADLDEVKLIELAQAEVDKFYPKLTEKVLAEANTQWMKEGGFMTMLPYALGRYSELVQRFYVRQLLRISQQGKVEGEGISLALPNDANSAFADALMEQIQEYAEQFKQEEDTIESREGQEYIVNKGVERQLNDAHRIIQDSFNNNHERYYSAYHNIRSFQTSLPYFIQIASSYLWTYSLVAKAEETEELVNRLMDLSKKEFILSKTGRSPLTPAQISATVAKGFQTGCQDKTEAFDNWRHSVAPKLYGEFLSLYGQETSSKDSLLLIRSLIRLCLTPPLSAIGGGFTNKVDLASLPFSNADDSNTKNALKAWDMLFELDEKNPDQRMLSWWSNNQDKAAIILSLNHDKANTLQATKSLFGAQFVGQAGNPELFKAIYELVLTVFEGDNGELNKANLAEKLDHKLDLLSNENQFRSKYLAIKLYIPNMIPKALNYFTAINELNDKQIEGAENEFNGPSGKYLAQAFNSLFKSINTHSANNKADLKDKIKMVSGKTVDSVVYTILKWGLRLLV